MPDFTEPPAEIRSYDPVELRQTPAHRFRRHRALANVGAVTMVGGGVVFSGALFVGIAGADTRGVPHTPGYIAAVSTGLFGGAGLIIGGDVLLTYGGAAAAHDVHLAGGHASPVFALAGAGLTLAGAAVGLSGGSADFSLAATLAGPTLGAVQLVVDDTAARRLGFTHLSVAPTPNGVMVAGRW